MFFILDNIGAVCSDPGLASILSIIKRFVNMLWLFGPILAIIAAVINGFKLMSNPEEKKYKGLFKNSIMALLFLFLLPTIVNAVMGALGNSFEFTACWNTNTNVSVGGQGGYIDENSGNKGGSMLTDPDEYETGTPSSSGSGVTGTSNNSSSNNSNTGSTTTNGATNLIFVGDSRTVGMKQAVGGNDTWSCKSSMGLSWMKSTGIPNVQNKITNGSAVIVLMGVNDLYNVNNYISYMNSLVNTVTSKGGTLYFVSVNPTSKSMDYLNSNIDSFNTKMRQGLSSSIKYIDTNSYLKANGFSSGDGLHYYSDTSKQIYNYIKSRL